jgi:TPR repeat protein
MKGILVAFGVGYVLMFAGVGASYADAFADWARGVAASERKDYKEAVKWHRKAAEQGLADSHYELGALYATGLGVSRDYKEAVYWYRKAAEQGLADAHYELGVMYANGRGVIKDYVYAHMWSNIAAAYGNTDAEKNRVMFERIMTMPQIAEAQKLARECVQKKYKGC